MAVKEPNPEMVEDVNKMVGAEYHVCGDLQDLHGVKSVAQSLDDYHVRVVAHDDYPVLSHIQTVCALNQCQFSIKSACRVDGDIEVRFYVEG